MVLDPIPQPLPVHFFGSRPQPPTSPPYFIRSEIDHLRVHTQKSPTHSQMNARERWGTRPSHALANEIIGLFCKRVLQKRRYSAKHHLRVRWGTRPSLLCEYRDHLRVRWALLCASNDK